ncbi:MAG: hypothetical protein SXU28_04485 [Pseudomonadota bacterium]|nr:hypothetical protein [Pseudomonadota bacterium]
MSEMQNDKEQQDRLLTALLVDAVQFRQSRGDETTLRDLHTLLDVPQNVALRLAHKLAEDGVAVIEENLADAFASQITISETILTRMARARRSFLDATKKIA